MKMHLLFLPVDAGRLLNVLCTFNLRTVSMGVSAHKYLELKLFDFRFFSEANLSMVMLPHLLSITSTKLKVVTQSLLSN